MNFGYFFHILHNNLISSVKLAFLLPIEYTTCSNTWSTPLLKFLASSLSLLTFTGNINFDNLHFSSRLTTLGASAISSVQPLTICLLSDLLV